ncbi:MAG: endonuclease/exonuclease/phosphatase family protein [Actinomycetota bacterium]
MMAVTRRRAPLAVLLAVALSAAACTRTPSGGGGSSAGNPAVGEQAPATGTVPFTLMEFNIEYGGGLVDFDSVPEAIRQSGAQVVAVEEAFGKIPKIAEALGWEYTDERLQLVSQVPLYAPPDGDPSYAFAELAPGKTVAISNIHLTSSPYGPNIIARKGANLQEVYAGEKKHRIPEITPIVETMGGLADDGFPSFIVGDFNTPSHRDWPEEMVGERPQIKFAVDWPVTHIVEDAGFTDSYRAIYPDPVANPGLTWPAWRPKVKGWNPVKGETLEDRIDMIFAAGPVTTVDSFVMGESGGPADETVHPWPTDHRALVSTFDVDLTDVPPPPNLVAVADSLVDVDTPLAVTFQAPGEDGERVVIVEEGGDPAAAVLEMGTGDGSPPSGTVTFDISEQPAAAHEVVLVDPAGAELASTPVWFQEPGAGPTVAAAKPSYRPGEPIMVEWYGAPANRWDWIGIFHRGDKPGQYLQWRYTKATVAGEGRIDASSPGPWPLEPGPYTVRLLLDDGYKVAAESDFVVK